MVIFHSYLKLPEGVVWKHNSWVQLSVENGDDSDEVLAWFDGIMINKILGVTWCSRVTSKGVAYWQPPWQFSFNVLVSRVIDQPGSCWCSPAVRSRALTTKRGYSKLVGPCGGRRFCSVALGSEEFECSIWEMFEPCMCPPSLLLDRGIMHWFFLLTAHFYCLQSSCFLNLIVMFFEPWHGQSLNIGLGQ